MNLRSLARSLLLGSVAALSLVVGCGGADNTASAGASITAAQTAQAESGGRWRHAPDPARMIQRLDANGDGALQVAELPAPMQARLADADANHDGVIAADELTARMNARRAERFARIDTNNDGAVTADEVAPERWTRLAAADADHDSRVTKSELEAAFASGAMRFGRGGHGRHGEGRGEGRGEAQARGGHWRHAPDPARMIQRFDANGDGALQVAELPAPMQSRAGLADADHDGVITAAELTAAVARRHAEQGAAPAAPAAQ